MIQESNEQNFLNQFASNNVACELFHINEVYSVCTTNLTDVEVKHAHNSSTMQAKNSYSSWIALRTIRDFIYSEPKFFLRCL